MVPTLEVVDAPCRIDGGISRAVSDGKTVWVETWGRAGWERGGATFDELAFAPPASPETLAKFGIPADEV